MIAKTDRPFIDCSDMEPVIMNRACPVNTQCMSWISVKDRLPEIPEGKHGVSVIVAEYDEIFAEGKSFESGYSIHEAIYDEDGVFKDFFYPDGEFISIFDPVTHWMPLPKPPEKNHA